MRKRVQLRKLMPDAVDVVGLLGAACLLYGIAQIHRPSAWIVGGMLTLTAAALLARKESKR